MLSVATARLQRRWSTHPCGRFEVAILSVATERLQHSMIIEHARGPEEWQRSASRLSDCKARVTQLLTCRVITWQSRASRLSDCKLQTLYASHQHELVSETGVAAERLQLLLFPFPEEQALSGRAARRDIIQPAHDKQRAIGSGRAARRDRAMARPTRPPSALHMTVAVHSV